MNDTLILALGLFLILPAACAWAWALACLIALIQERRTNYPAIHFEEKITPESVVRDYKAMVGNLESRHYTPAQRKRALRAVTGGKA